MEEELDKPKRKRRSRKRLLWKIPLMIVSGVAGLLLLVMVVSSIVLTPARLTRWVEEYGTDYLANGRVEVERVELSIWSTFPHVELNVKNLRVINEDESIPEEYRTVLSLEGLSGRLDVISLLTERIDIRHVELVSPEVTYWSTDTLTSLSILPESEEALELPNFRMSRFDIEGQGKVRYIAPASDIDATFYIERTSLRPAAGASEYTLEVKGKLGPFALLPVALPMSIDGEVDWNPVHPMQIKLGNFTLDLGLFKSYFSLSADFTDRPVISALTLELEPLPLGYFVSLMRKINGTVPKIESDAEVSFKLALNEPFDLADSTAVLPPLHVEIGLADGPVSVTDLNIGLENLGLELVADLDPRGADSSRVELRRMNLKFPAADFALNAEVTNLATDPAVKGRFAGSIDFTRMDARAWRLLGMKLMGKLDANVDFDLRLSHFAPNTFHRAGLAGEATLRDFKALLPGDSVTAGVTRARFRFGTSESVRTASARIDSMLTASLTVDSAWVRLPEMSARLGGVEAAFGMENRHGSADTTTVTPMGGRFSVRTLRWQSAGDSTLVALRQLGGKMYLKRFQGGIRAPQLGAELKAERIACVSGTNRLFLTQAEIYADSHLSASGKKRRPMSAADSLRRAARRDSLLAAEAGFEKMDFKVDRATVSLLRRWNVSGGVKAARGRLITPAFPLRTVMTNLDFAFNADSLHLRSLRLQTGGSDFSLTGLVSDIQRALGRRGGRPLRIDLQLSSDTLNVNELTDALFRGAAATAAMQPDSLLTELSENAAQEAMVTSEEMMAPVVPMNVDARLGFAARNVVYSTLPLRNFRGEVLLSEGAANLSELHAESEIGAVDLNMLYYAPRRSDVSFGMGLDLTRFNIGRIDEVLPVLDSLMPILNTLAGVVDVNISATAPVDSALNVDMAQARAMVRISGDSLKLIDERTFKKMSKWLMFKNKEKNIIDHADVQLTLEDNMLNLYPFMFDFDRYRLGVMGHNDMDMNLNYHVSVLKSPVPFRFGINIKGTAEKMKIRLGRAKFKEEMVAQSVALSDTVRLNLAREIRSVFATGANKARLGSLRLTRPERMPELSIEADTLSAADSLYMINEGLIDLPTDSIK